jgi:hypothetical protein
LDGTDFILSRVEYFFVFYFAYFYNFFVIIIIYNSIMKMEEGNRIMLYRKLVESNCVNIYRR